MVCSAFSAYFLARMLRLWVSSVDVPFGDQWVFPPLLEHAERGIPWSELWAPHNEHRIVLPRIIMLALARLTGWNVRSEILLVHLIVISTFILVVWWVRRLFVDRRLYFASLPLLSVFLFSRAQAENLVWGWQIQIVLSAFCTLAALLALGSTRRHRFLFAVVLGLSAQFSFGSGVLVWPIGLLLIGARVDLDRSNRWKRATVWSVVGLFATVLYRIGLSVSTSTDGLSLRTIVEYSVHYLGSPLVMRTSRGELGWRFGLLGLALLLIGSILAWRSGDFVKRAPIIAWGLTAPGSALITAYARSGSEPVFQAMTSRYTTLSLPLWIASALLLVAEVDRRLVRKAVFSKSLARDALVLSIATIPFAIFHVSDHWEIWANGRMSQSRAAQAELCALNPNLRQVADLLAIEEFRVAAGVPVLRARDLSLFRSEGTTEPC
jgi:hypothetical protein